MGLNEQESAFLHDAIAAGIPEDVIAQKIRAKRQATAAPPPPGRGGRGDELFQHDPDPSGPLVNLRGEMLRQPKANGQPNYATMDATHDVLVDGVPVRRDDPRTRELQALSGLNSNLRGFAASQGVGGIVGDAVGSAIGPAKTALGRIASAAAQGAAGAGAGNLAQSAVQGDAPAEVAKATGKGVLGGGLVSGGLATVGEMLTGAARATRASKGGQARALIEKYGGKVGPFDSGSGIPELDGLKTVTDADIGAQARSSGQKLIDANDRMFDAEGRQPYKAAVANVERLPADGGIPASQRPVDVTALHQKMMQVALDPSTDPAVKSVLESQMAEMEKLPRNREGIYIADERWVNGKTQMLWRLAKPEKLAAGAGTPRDAVFGEVASVGQQLREQGPYADANAAYAGAKTRSQDFRRALGMKGAPNPDEEVDAAKVANFLSRRGQTTTTAGIRGTEERLQQLAQQYPGLERTIDAPAMVQAKGDLQFGLGHTGGLINRGPKHFALDLAMRNADALMGRVAAGAPASAAMAAGGAASAAAVPTAEQLMAAYQAKRLKDAAIIDGIFGKKKQQPDNQGAPDAVRQ